MNTFESTFEQTILLTGFGPFPGAAKNPSELLARAMGERPTSPLLPSCELVGASLPTHWQKVRPALTSLLARYRPQIILHIGYASTSPGFHLETTAYNKTCNNPDIEGVPGTCAPILMDSPALIKNTLPLETIATRLVEAGFSAKTSDDPGLYLCNMAYYLSLCHALGCSKAYPVARHHSCLFVHIPALETDDGLLPQEEEGDNRLTLEDACNGLQLLLEELVKAHAPSRELA
ncbi:MAG: pyroglutamyl-peptidase I [Hyphomicrobiaceae bacterium]|nr:pyroglutamyl-peptidase I [Hyphomicrobiaceae bacterium]